MGEITPQVRARYPRVADAIPSAVLAKIDTDEILDRCAAATDLHTKADKAASPDLAQGYRERARRLLRAAPREETEIRAALWEARADEAVTSVHRSFCLTKADEIRAEQPAAPRLHRQPPDPETLEKAQAVKRLRVAVAADVAALAKTPNNAPVDRATLARMARVAVAEATGFLTKAGA